VTRQFELPELLVPGLVLGLDSRRMLLNRRQLTIEGFACEKILQGCRFGSQVLGHISSSRRKGHSDLSASRARSSRATAAPKELVELHSTLDSVLNGRWEALNVAIALSSEPENGLHLADGSFENDGTGKSIRDELAVRGRNGVLMARYLLAKLRYDGSGIQLADFASKRVLKASEAFTSSANSMPFFGGMKLAGRSYCSKTCRALQFLSRSPLSGPAGRLNFSSAQQ